MTEVTEDHEVRRFYHFRQWRLTMEAIGYLFMALFGAYFFFVARHAYRQEIMFRGKAKGPLGLVGQLGLFNANRMRAALAFFALVALSVNVLFFYAFDLPLKGALIAEAVGVGVGLGFYLTIVRPLQRAQERHFEKIRETLEEIMTPRANASGAAARAAEEGDDSATVEIPDPQICIYPPMPGIESKPKDEKPDGEKKDGETADGESSQQG